MQRSSPSGLLAAVCTLAACSGTPAPPPDTCSNIPASALAAAWTVDPHYCMIRYADGLTGPRQLAVAPNGDLFVMSGDGQIVVLLDTNGDGVSDPSERTVFATMRGGNHGLAITSTHVYASATDAVFRWPYAAGDHVATGPQQVVILGIPAGGHSTRTLIVDGQNRLYVSIGSAANVDAPVDGNTPQPMRAVIRRFDLSAIPAAPFQGSDGELFAAGLRNEVGLFIDSKGRMWGVENGRDNLMVGGDIHFDNPAEEVNLFDTNRAGRNYGYPFCWSEGIWMDTAMAKGAGTQHLDPDEPGAFTEAKCQDASVVVPPAFALGAHLAPLDIVEYTGKGYPAALVGNLFVASHGSWNRESGQVGRMIIRLKTGAGGPTAAENFLGESDGAGGLRQGTWGVRPVSIRVDADGLLAFSDDLGGAVYKIGYNP